MGHSIKYIGHFVLLTSYQYVIFLPPWMQFLQIAPLDILLPPIGYHFPPLVTKFFTFLKKIP